MLIPQTSRILAPVLALTGLWLFLAADQALAGQTVVASGALQQMEWIEVSKDKHGFELSGSHKQFTPWGFNYDHDDSGEQRLLEDYWDTEWDKVKQALHGRKLLGANVVRRSKIACKLFGGLT